MTSCIDFERLEREIYQLRSVFQLASPFPNVVIDDFLHRDCLYKILGKLPAPKRAQKSNDYIFAKEKFENPTFWSMAPILEQLRSEILSDRLAAIFSAVVDRELFVDPKFVGCGLHQGGAGSFLDIHADFSRHLSESKWLRELNLLLHLNEDWEPGFGGQLNLRHAETGEQGAVEPRLNRMVCMLTKGLTLHGYKPLCIPEGRYRTSVAACAYSLDEVYAANLVRTTVWRPEAAGIAKSLAAKLSPTLVRLKNTVLGSNTARRANGDGGPSGRSWSRLALRRVLPT